MNIVGCDKVVPQGTFSCGFAAIHLVAPYDKTGNEIFFPA